MLCMAHPSLLRIFFDAVFIALFLFFGISSCPGCFHNIQQYSQKEALSKLCIIYLFVVLLACKVIRCRVFVEIILGHYLAYVSFGHPYGQKSG